VEALVAALLAKGFNLLGGAVLAKGKEVIEDQLGVSLKEDPTQAELMQYKQLEIEHEEFLIKAAQDKANSELEELKVENANTADAREMNVKIQEASNASKLAKNASYYIDFIIIVATVCLVGFLLFKGVPGENKEIFFTALGSLMTMCGTILNFHRGTSAKSHAKDETIFSLMSQQSTK
jgi:hypothetical protein